MASRKSHGSVRMGPVSLFALIIALCLAVMAVLSVSTAKATYAATQRLADSTTELYTLEQSGQQFVANVDATLANAYGHDSGVAALEAAGDGLLDGAQSDSVHASLLVGDAASGASADGAADGAAEGATEGAATGGAAEETIDDGTGTGASADASVDAQANADASAEEAAASSGYNPDVIATFTTDSGRCLVVQLAVNSDGTYQILQWKSSTLWTSNTGNDVLWSGTSTNE